MLITRPELFDVSLAPDNFRTLNTHYKIILWIWF